jgi:hypothetical protein
MQRRSPGYCNLQLEHQEFLSTALRIYRGVMDPDASQLKKPVTSINCRKHILGELFLFKKLTDSVLIALTCPRTSHTISLFRNCHWRWRKRLVLVRNDLPPIHVGHSLYIQVSIWVMLCVAGHHEIFILVACLALLLYV